MTVKHDKRITVNCHGKLTAAGIAWLQTSSSPCYLETSLLRNTHAGTDEIDTDEIDIGATPG